jgi:mannose-6-phosphate isomerase-like protein (cupin superfamily)
MEASSERRWSPSSGPGFVSVPGTGTSYQVLGFVTTLRAHAQNVGGLYEVMDSVFPPERGMFPHVHQHTHESLIIVDGEILLRIGEHETLAPAGTVAFIPRGTVHGFRNVGTVDCRALFWMMPTVGVGLEKTLEALSRLSPDVPNTEELASQLRELDLEPVLPPRAGTS